MNTLDTERRHHLDHLPTAVKPSSPAKDCEKAHFLETFETSPEWSYHQWNGLRWIEI